MPRFFVRKDQISENTVTLMGDDAHHVSRSLRMAAGEHITVCDMQGFEYACELTDFLSDCVRARVLSVEKSDTEPPYFACVYQALPKGDKLDAVIQKAVECGACEIVTFESERCITRVKDQSEEKKLERRRKIAQEAAKQCGRGVLPVVQPTMRFREAVERASRADIPLFCYEGDGTTPLPQILKELRRELPEGQTPSVSIVIGSEGGFSIAEAEWAISQGMKPVGLGKRILRTETAASFVLSCLVYEFELSK